jgi:hypothetical protein
MTDYNEEYFYLHEDELDKYPCFDYASRNGFTSMELFDEFVLDTTRARCLCFGYPIPRNPKLADFHFLKESAPVISERLKNVLESLNLKDMQFLPAIIRDKSGEEHSGYYIIHVVNLIKCMDKEKSVWEPNVYQPGEAFSVDKLVLDNEVLDKIPLEERLVFAVWENSLKVLYHYSVVEKLLEIDPKGMTIYRLSKYDSSLPFKAEYISKLLDNN